MRDVANYVALPAAIIGSASALIGGALADRAAKRHGVWAQSWVVTIMKLVALPFAIGFYFVDDWRAALACYFVAAIFAGAYLGPTFAMIQHLAPVRLRATWAALSLLTINLIGLGLGPFLVGQLSDWLKPTMGAESLRYAMLTVALLTPWAIVHYWRAGVLMRRSEMD
jgi:nitrate/nitrite transporter NarK